MRAGMLGVFALLLPTIALAQVPKGKPAGKPDQDPEKLERLLRDWDLKGRDMRDLRCEFRRISREQLFGKEELEYGVASAIKPYRGRLDLMDEKGKFTQIFIYTGKRLHQYDFKSKQEIIHILPDPEPGATNSMPGTLAFLYGMSAAETKTRFNLTLIKEFSKGGVDYAEIHATPRTQADQQDFKLAQIVINKKTFLPKEMRLIEPNGNEQHWIFDKLETNANPPVSSAELEPFDRRKYKELEKWKQTINNLADPPQATRAPKTKSGPPAKAPTEAGRKAPPKR